MPAIPKPDSDTLRTSWTLVARLKDAEDHEGWREFYQLYRRVILGVAKKAGLRKEEADEVLQDSLWSVSKRIQEFAADPRYGSFRAWLLTLVRWRIVDQFRKRHPDADNSVDQDETAGTSPIHRLANEEEVDLAALCDREWERLLLRKALKQLQLEVNAEHYQIFHLLVEEHHPPKEVACLVGCRASRVYLIRLRLARRLKVIAQRLREKLE